jgi:hypothetical protein
MNSIEALDYAIQTVRAKRVIAPELASKEAALETLQALRETIADQEAKQWWGTRAAAEQAAEDHLSYAHHMSMPERHLTDIAGKPGDYVARCSCGWVQP